jgi:hypothetical protein
MLTTTTTTMNEGFSSSAVITPKDVDSPSPSFQPRLLCHPPHAHPLPSIHLSIAVPPFNEMPPLPPLPLTNTSAIYFCEVLVATNSILFLIAP